MFNEHSFSTISEPKTIAWFLDEPGARSRRSDGLEGPKSAGPITCDGSSLVNSWSSNHRSLQGSQLSMAPDDRSKEVPTAANTIMDFLKDLSDSLEEVYYIASSEQPSSGACSPSPDAFSHVSEPKTQAGVSSNEPPSVSEIHDLFESCAESISSLLDLVDLSYPAKELSPRSCPFPGPM